MIKYAMYMYICIFYITFLILFRYYKQESIHLYINIELSLQRVSFRYLYKYISLIVGGLFGPKELGYDHFQYLNSFINTIQVGLIISAFPSSFFLLRIYNDNQQPPQKKQQIQKCSIESEYDLSRITAGRKGERSKRFEI